MPITVDYFFAPQSPWAYVGHARFAQVAAAAKATVRVRPMDLGQVFPVSGGLALPQRAPQRQAYRLVELQRYSDWLQLPLNVKPKFFPVAGDAAARLIVAAGQAEGADAALALAGRVLAAVWAQDRNIADDQTLAELLAEAGLAASLLDASRSDAVRAAYQQHTDAAITGGVFGSPSYVVDGEIFWGQDRLDFLQRRLAQG
jgi:carboxymethylenebutenolidase